MVKEESSVRSSCASDALGVDVLITESPSMADANHKRDVANFFPQIRVCTSSLSLPDLHNRKKLWQHVMHLREGQYRGRWPSALFGYNLCFGNQKSLRNRTKQIA